MKNFKSNFATQKLSKKEAQNITGGKKQEAAECFHSVPVGYQPACQGMKVVYSKDGCWAGCF